MGSHPMLKSGDRVIIDGGPLVGTVKTCIRTRQSSRSMSVPDARRAGSRSSRCAAILR